MLFPKYRYNSCRNLRRYPAWWRVNQPYLFFSTSAFVFLWDKWNGNNLTEDELFLISVYKGCLHLATGSWEGTFLVTGKQGNLKKSSRFRTLSSFGELIFLQFFCTYIVVLMTIIISILIRLEKKKKDPNHSLKIVEKEKENKTAAGIKGWCINLLPEHELWVSEADCFGTGKTMRWF